MSSQRVDGRPRFLWGLQAKFDSQFAKGFQETDLTGHPSGERAIRCASKLRSEESVFPTFHWEQNFRNRNRSVVGPPRNVDWTQPWHEILHHWNGRIQQLKCKPWSEMCLQHHWNLAHYFALLPDHRWFKRVLHWNPCGRRRVGRPKNSWDTILENFCRLKGLPSWEVAAMDQDLWSSSLAEFLHFCKW